MRHSSVSLLGAMLRWAGWWLLGPVLFLLAFGTYVQLDGAEAPRPIERHPVE